MKKGTSILISLALVSGLVTFGLAQTQTKAVPPLQKTFMGTVDKVTPADPAKGTKPEITVIHKANKSMTFIITDTCTIYDATGTATTLDKVVKGSKVSVKYQTTAQGVNEAASIKLLK